MLMPDVHGHFLLCIAMRLFGHTNGRRAAACFKPFNRKKTHGGHYYAESTERQPRQLNSRQQFRFPSSKLKPVAFNGFGGLPGISPPLRQIGTPEAAPSIDTKRSLPILQDEMYSEALLFEKCTVYAGYFNDPALKRMAENAAGHHRQAF